MTGVLSSALWVWVSNKQKYWKRKCEKEKVKEVNVFEEYVAFASDSAQPVISYGDPNAISIEPFVKSGKVILKAKVDFSNRPAVKDKRDFVMALLKYLPPKDWSVFAELDYCLSFKIRGTIKGVQLEVKDSAMKKVIDQFIPVTECFVEHVISLRGKEKILDCIEEVCFTVFDEEKYHFDRKGDFEVYECMLKKQ